MGYQELIFDSAVSFQSSTKYPATDTPVFRFGSGIQKIVYAKILEVVLPVSWYNFVPYPGVIADPPVDYIQNGVQRYAPHGHQTYKIVFYNPQTNASFNQDLPPGSGSALEFVNYMNTVIFGNPTLFNAFKANFLSITGVALTSVTLTYTPDREVIEWRLFASVGLGPSVFGVKFQENFPTTHKGLPFPAYSLGFSKLENPFQMNLSYLSFTSEFCNANPFNYVHLHSKALGSVFKVQSNFARGDIPNVYNYDIQDSSTQLAMIPLDQNYKSMVIWKDPNPDAKFSEINQQFQQIDFYLTLGPYVNEPLNLNGQSFQVKMGIETEDNDLYSNKRARF